MVKVGFFNTLLAPSEALCMVNLENNYSLLPPKTGFNL